MKSVKSGNWLDPSVWDSNTGVIEIQPGHQITIDAKVELRKPQIINNGLIIGRPQGLLKLLDVIESAFEGGGHDPKPNDLGLWIMGSGRIDAQGSPKTGWTEATKGLPKGATVLPLKDIKGWKQGDDILIVAMAGIGPRPKEEYEERKIVSFTSTTVTIDRPLDYDHPMVHIWTPEVVNLTRDFNIEGTPTGRSHVLIRSNGLQLIKHVGFRWMGPRKDINGDGRTELVLGRYACHFHHCDWIKGTLVEGCVVRDGGNHGFVPHGSHGITVRGNVAYNNIEVPYWYDPQHSTHELTYENNIGVCNHYISGSLAADAAPQPGKTVLEVAEMSPTMSIHEFNLGAGFGNKCIGNRSIGDYGLSDGDGGAVWPADSETGAWDFRNHLSHNCHVGNRVWDNSSTTHTDKNYMSFNCEEGLEHGAYVNNFARIGGLHYNSPFYLRANSGSSYGQKYIGIEFINPDMDYSIITRGANASGKWPTLFYKCKFTNGGRKADVFIDSQTVNNGDPNQPFFKYLDFVECGDPRLEWHPNTHAGERVRVQNGNVAYEVTKAGRRSIPVFAPTFWGDGDGLTAKYFKNLDFTGLVAERIDNSIHFDSWPDRGGAYHTISGLPFSVVWEGFIQAQFTEDYTFSIDSRGDTVMIIGTHTKTGSGSIRVPMKAGDKVPFKVTMVNRDPRAIINVHWTSPSMEKWKPGGEYISREQLYPLTTTPPPPVNTAPKVNAGLDQTITLPVNSIFLKGNVMDAEGDPLTYKWEEVIGSLLVPIGNTIDVEARNLAEGNHLFRLTASDDKGLTAFDEVLVGVKPAPVTPPPPPVDVNSVILTDIPVTVKGLKIHAAKDGSAKITSTRNTLLMTVALTAGDNFVNVSKLTQKTLWVFVNGEKFVIKR